MASKDLDRVASAQDETRYVIERQVHLPEPVDASTHLDLV